MKRVRRSGRADRLAPGLATLLVALLPWLPEGARAGPCADPAAVAMVLRLLSDRLGLAGTLSLENIRRSDDEPVAAGPACAADIVGIRNPPTMFGHTLDMVLYWDAVAAGAPVVAARLMPRRPPKAPPALVDAAAPIH